MTKSGSKLSLSMMIAFNQSDSTFGWFNFLTGMTGLGKRLRILLYSISLTNDYSAYISDPLEYTINTKWSLSLPPSVVPILSIEQVHTTKLGSPYSDCRKEEDHSLRWVFI